MTNNVISDYFNNADKILVYIDNNIEEYTADTIEFKQITDSLQKIVTNAHEIPAYGVSIDSETREAIKQGTWVELKYKSTETHNEMPFDSLLIKVDSEYSGFNLIRLHDNQYEGRCFYLSLDNTMEELYNTLQELI